MTSGWTAVATLDELWEGEMTSVTVNRVRVLLVHVAGAVRAYEDRCPHLANPLSKGTLDGDVLICAAHEWCFDVVAGTSVNPAGECLRPIPVHIDGDSILIDANIVIS